jgi:nucleoside-diphosphate-sugar epimerase
MASPPPHYLVTGGAGFIGSHLVEALVARGRRVRVLDDLSTGRRENLAAVAEKVELVVGDIRDLEVCRRACAGVDYVLHHAAKVSVAESVERPIETHEVDALGTLKVLIAARDAGCKRLVYAGSASVYGNCELSPQHEGLAADPLSPYAIAKHVGELYCRAFYGLYGFETVVLRYFNIFGPRQDPGSPYSGVIARFIRQLARDESPAIQGDGEQSRDFVPVANVVEANLLACTSPNAVGQTINVGCGTSTTINQLARMLIETTGSDRVSAHADSRPGDVRHSLADITRARDLLGYEVTVTPEEGLRATVAWYRENAT